MAQIVLTPFRYSEDSMPSTLKRTPRALEFVNPSLSRRAPSTHRALFLPACSLCSEPVQLEISKTDEGGKAVHDECYILGLKSNSDLTS
jgi:hypothetical protein